MTQDQRALFETAVVDRLKESGFLEIEIRTECLVRSGDGYQDEVINAGWHYWNTARATSQASETARLAAQNPAHFDNKSVFAFAYAMRVKLAAKRLEGRGGWQDTDTCSNDHLSRLLWEHVEKGDPVDVGNFCMMIHQRGESIAPAPRQHVDATIRNGISAALVAMKLAAALPGVSKEYNFAEAIEAIEAAWLAVKAPPQPHFTGWQSMETAPKDGTILHLLVRPGQEDLDPLTSFHDSREPYETIGFNHLKDTLEDVWQFAGWD